MRAAAALMIIGLIIAVFFGWLLYRGFMTGKMWVRKSFSASHATKPIIFWATAGLNVAMIALGLWWFANGLSGLSA